MLIIFEVQIELPIIRLDGLFERLEQVMDVIHGERRLTKDTHDFEDRPASPTVFMTYAKGDSMEGVHIHNGDMLFMDNASR